MQNKFLLYGANGYTGKLIASMASQFNLIPVLAGRNSTALKEMALELSLEFVVVNLDDATMLASTLKNFPLVLHAAGPFKFTAQKMAKACLATGVHYLDITGEIAVFELLKKMDGLAKEKGIMIMPGVGFDVVPTDCMAKFLHDKMPNATHLKLAFATIGGKLSHGTATTMAEGMGEGGAVRENGKIVRKPLGHKGFWVDFGVKKMFVMTIPWGDISTAYTTTLIPNIETYTAASPKTFSILKWQKWFNWLLQLSIVRNYYKKKIKKMPAGPDEQMRLKAKSLVWGEVRNDQNETLVATLQGPEGYTLTAISSLIITQKVLSGNFKTGYQTPAACYGADLVLEIDGVTRSIN
ncbi:saccharopine dehydrogenase family protein [Sediminibacterium sp.]|uniref:saccharopine dehydrogenase family protein n=1 Tax=Sediminibacterium sp. TaxID=1917865 RepID=UPI003F70AFD2